jgi:hypothetical protein
MDNSGFGYGQRFNMTPNMPFHMMPQYNRAMTPQEMARLVQGTSVPHQAPPYPHQLGISRQAVLPHSVGSNKAPGSRQRRWTDIEVRINQQTTVKCVNRPLSGHYQDTFNCCLTSSFTFHPHKGQETQEYCRSILASQQRQSFASRSEQQEGKYKH